MLVAINSFVRRQTKDSPFTHFIKGDEQLLLRVEQGINDGNFTQGYREGVILVNVPVEGFFTGLVELEDGDILIGEFKARREGEEPRKSVQVKRGKKHGKQQAQCIQVICYRHDVLAKDGDAETDAEWEIISLNGYPTDEIAPIDPVTLMHNHFGSDGGTETNMNPEEFETQMKKSFRYWKNKMLMAHQYQSLAKWLNGRVELNCDEE